VSGFLALLDDVAAIAKLAATQIDDIAAHATKAGGKSAGIVIDDAAVTPKYVTGLPAAREIPIVAKIAAGSLISKLAILLPVLLLLQAFAPGAIPPLLILGGAYLCFEGAEKIWHVVIGHEEKGPQQAQTIDAAHLEEQRVKGAIKTDFILSAEIMTIALSTIDVGDLWIRAVVLAVIAVSFTVLVYGVVALLVKIDDIGDPQKRACARALARHRDADGAQSDLGCGHGGDAVGWRQYRSAQPTYPSSLLAV
jgi:predicted DNA repair protein MutK